MPPRPSLWTPCPEQLPNGINGLQLQLLDPSDPTHLAAALDQVEARLGGLLPGLFQFSVGGSFPLTDPAFDLAGLEEILRRFRARWGLLLYLEVGGRGGPECLCAPPPSSGISVSLPGGVSAHLCQTRDRRPALLPLLITLLQKSLR